jgi:Na+/proline symporter
LFWRRATPQGALLSTVFGLVSWVLAELVAPDAVLPPQLVGLAFAVFGMVAGSLMPPVAGGPGQPEVVDQAARAPRA